MGNKARLYFVCLGYNRGDDGNLVIDELDAEIVSKMFEIRADGESLGAISYWLHENKIPLPTGKEHWSRETISKLLRNGCDIIDQTRKSLINQGEQRFGLVVTAKIRQK